MHATTSHGQSIFHHAGGFPDFCHIKSQKTQSKSNKQRYHIHTMTRAAVTPKPASTPTSTKKIDFPEFIHIDTGNFDNNKEKEIAMTSTPKITLSADDEGIIYCEEYKPPFLVALIMAFPIIPLFWTYSVKISGSSLRFGYSSSLTSKRTSLLDIIDAKPIYKMNSLKEGWGGWGIRHRFRNGHFQTGYIAKNGGAVEVTIMSKSRKGIDTECETKENTYVFSCEDPEKVCNILLSHNK